MTWTPLALATQSNKSRFGFEGAARLVNMYAESTGQEAKNTFALYATEGLDTWVTPAVGRTWALIKTDTMLYGVTGRQVWGIDLNNVKTNIFTLPIEGACYFARNRRNPTTEVGLVTAQDNKYYVITGTGIVNVTTGLIGTPTSLDVRDGYFCLSTNFNRYQITGEDNATSLSVLNFGKAQRSPDEIMRVISTETDIVLMGPDSIEWHQNSPSTTATFPFVPVANIELGLLSARAAVRLDRDIYFAASDGTVRRMEGYGGAVISNADIERAIGAVIDKSTIFAFAWNARSIGKSFVCFSCPDWTWVYDVRENLWHERQSYGRTFWRVSAVVEWQGRVIAGDFETGELYDLRGDLLDEAGEPLVCTAQTPPVDAFPYPVVIHALAVDVVPGVGRNTPAAPQNQDPVIMISYSDDGGKTWSAERHEKIGRAGQTNTRVRTRRLGMMRRNGRTFKFSMSADVARCIQSAAIDVEKLGA
jgi:hypothetical protein